jgi:ABC-type transport system involved in multi-copper enzyme maturation permease subunit
LTLASVARANGPHTANIIQPPVLELIFDVAICGLGAMIMGLLISAAVSTSDKATPFMAGIIAMQLLLGGALFDVRPIPVMSQLSALTTTRWGYAAVSSTTDSPKLVIQKCHQPPNTSCESTWKHTKGAWLTDIGALLAICAVGIALSTWLLKRRDPKTTRKLRA